MPAYKSDPEKCDDESFIKLLIMSFAQQNAC
jgi:hypothetical protein